MGSSDILNNIQQQEHLYSNSTDMATRPSSFSAAAAPAPTAVTSVSAGLVKGSRDLLSRLGLTNKSHFRSSSTAGPIKARPASLDQPPTPLTNTYPHRQQKHNPINSSQIRHTNQTMTDDADDFSLLTIEIDESYDCLNASPDSNASWKAAEIDNEHSVHNHNSMNQSQRSADYSGDVRQPYGSGCQPHTTSSWRANLTSATLYTQQDKGSTSHCFSRLKTALRSFSSQPATTWVTPDYLGAQHPLPHHSQYQQPSKYQLQYHQGSDVPYFCNQDPASSAAVQSFTVVPDMDQWYPVMGGGEPPWQTLVTQQPPQTHYDQFLAQQQQQYQYYQSLHQQKQQQQQGGHSEQQCSVRDVEGCWQLVSNECSEPDSQEKSGNKTSYLLQAVLPASGLMSSNVPASGHYPGALACFQNDGTTAGSTLNDVATHQFLYSEQAEYQVQDCYRYPYSSAVSDDSCPSYTSKEWNPGSGECSPCAAQGDPDECDGARPQKHSNPLNPYAKEWTGNCHESKLNPEAEEWVPREAGNPTGAADQVQVTARVVEGDMVLFSVEPVALEEAECNEVEDNNTESCASEQPVEGSSSQGLLVTSSAADVESYFSNSELDVSDMVDAAGERNASDGSSFSSSSTREPESGSHLAEVSVRLDSNTASLQVIPLPSTTDSSSAASPSSSNLSSGYSSLSQLASTCSRQGASCDSLAAPAAAVVCDTLPGELSPSAVLKVPERFYVEDDGDTDSGEEDEGIIFVDQEDEGHHEACQEFVSDSDEEDSDDESDDSCSSDESESGSFSGEEESCSDGDDTACSDGSLSDDDGILFCGSAQEVCDGRPADSVRLQSCPGNTVCQATKQATSCVLQRLLPSIFQQACDSITANSSSSSSSDVALSSRDQTSDSEDSESDEWDSDCDNSSEGSISAGDWAFGVVLRNNTNSINNQSRLLTYVEKERKNSLSDIEKANLKWDTEIDLDVRESRGPKVNFSDLVTVATVEADVERRGEWEQLARDGIRFRDRIHDKFRPLLLPVLEPSHRDLVFQSRFQGNEGRFGAATKELDEHDSGTTRSAALDQAPLDETRTSATLSDELDDSRPAVTNGDSVDVSNGDSVDVTNGDRTDVADGNSVDVTNGDSVDVTNGDQTDACDGNCVVTNGDSVVVSNGDRTDISNSDRVPMNGVVILMGGSANASAKLSGRAAASSEARTAGCAS